jgi:hypothetical protein
MSSLISATLQCPFKIAMQTMQNRVGPGVNRFASSRGWMFGFKFMDLFDTTLQVHVPTVYLTQRKKSCILFGQHKFSKIKPFFLGAQNLLFLPKTHGAMCMELTGQIFGD